MTVAAMIDRMVAEQPRPGTVAVELWGGPYDGCTTYVEASALLRIIRAEGAVCIPLGFGNEKTAAYRIESDGPLFQGVEGFFRGYAGYVPDVPGECGGM